MLSRTASQLLHGKLFIFTRLPFDKPFLCSPFNIESPVIVTFQALFAISIMFHTEGAKVFKKVQLQGRLKYLNLEQDPGHNGR